MKKKILVFILAVSCLGLVEGSAATGAQKKKDNKSYVYVCNCLHGQSCDCMSMAMHQGPCACGVNGGPPMARVQAQSNWAKYNRQMLTAGKQN